MRAEEFQRRLDACHDARRDPLDDSDLRDWLDAHPERCEEFARQRALLLGIERSPRPRARVATRWRVASAAALVVAGVAALWSHSMVRDKPVLPLPAERARVIAVTFEATKTELTRTITYTSRELDIEFGDTRVLIADTRVYPR